MFFKFLFYTGKHLWAKPRLRSCMFPTDSRMLPLVLICPCSPPCSPPPPPPFHYLESMTCTNTYNKYGLLTGYEGNTVQYLPEWHCHEGMYQRRYWYEVICCIGDGIGRSMRSILRLLLPSYCSDTNFFVDQKAQMYPHCMLPPPPPPGGDMRETLSE